MELLHQDDPERFSNKGLVFHAMCNSVKYGLFHCPTVYLATHTVSRIKINHKNVFANTATTQEQQ